MTHTANQAAAIAAAKLAERTTEQLCCDLRATDAMMDDPNTPTVRGWIMGELERRDPKAFDAWLDCSDPVMVDNPGLFFLPE
jgi:hypothetical protein